MDPDRRSAPLNGLIPEFGLTALTDTERDDLNRVWHRLSPWPDTVSGLTRLRTSYVLATLLNGNVALLVNMAKHSGLPWDAVLSAELAHQYKPDPEVYLTAADLLGLEPQQVMMVAAHKATCGQRRRSDSRLALCRDRRSMVRTARSTRHRTRHSTS